MASIFIGFVSVFCLVMAWVAAGAYQRTHNRKLLFLPAAFLLFMLKVIGLAVFIFMDQPGRALEQTGLEWGIGYAATLDLLIMILLILPLLLRKPINPTALADG